MKSLFAPWRMEFIEGSHQSHGDCILCHLVAQSTNDRENLILSRNKYTYLVLNKFPYANAHLMIVPFRHCAEWTELSGDELAEIGSMTQKAIRVLRSSVKPEGINLGVNLGRAAGAGIENHVHQHIVPRWVGDFNFMPLLAEVKVISEHLLNTYDRLVKAWGAVQ